MGFRRFSKQISLLLAVLTCALLTQCTKQPQALTVPPEGDAPSLIGGGSIGGDDILDAYSGSAWFLGEGPIHYCIEVDPSFPLSEAEVRSGVVEAIETWKSYIADNEINQATVKEGYGRLTLKYEPQSKCNKASDLKFLFGVETPAVTRGKKRLNDPLAFAEASGKPDSGWQKGFIWLGHPKRIASFQTCPYEKKHLVLTLLHELGHVYGNGHLAGTVMTASAVDLFNHATNAVQYAANPEETVPAKVAIDWTEQLYTCIGTELLAGDPDRSMGCKRRTFRAYRNDVTKAIVERWLGQKLSDDYKVSVTIDKPKAIFTILDGAKKYEVAMPLSKHISDRRFYNAPEHCNSGGERIFYRTFPMKEDGTICAYLYRVEGRAYTNVARSDGTPELLTVDFEINGRFAVHASGPEKWEEMSFYEAEDTPLSQDFKESLAPVDALLERLHHDYSYSLKDRYDAVTAKKLREALERPLDALYWTFLGFYNEARFEGLTAFMLTPKFEAVAVKYEAMKERLKTVEGLLNEKDRKDWDDLNVLWPFAQLDFPPL